MLYTRLIRLTRLSKLIAIFDISRFNRIIKSYYENSTRADRLQSQYAAMFVYRIFRLIIIAFMITYFVGCCWWFLVRNINSSEDWKNNNTFIQYWSLNHHFNNQECIDLNCDTDEADGKCEDADWIETNCEQDGLTQTIIVCYFALTTLSTVGYGDYFPITMPEKIFGIIFMLIGIVYFSHVMNSFI